MADLKKLIGNALNKAKSSKPSDDGYKTKKLKGMTVKQGMDYQHKQNIETAKKGINTANENLFKAKNPGFNPNVPASSKTTKPEKIMSAQSKRNEEQAKFGSKTYSSELGGYSPKRKEERFKEIKSGFVSGIKSMQDSFKPRGKKSI